MRYLLLAPLIFLSTAQASPWDVCIMNPDIDLMFDYSKQVLEGIELESLDDNPQEFCDEHMAKRYLLGSKKVQEIRNVQGPDGVWRGEELTREVEYASAEEVMASKARKELEKLLSEKAAKEHPGLWNSTLIPLERLRTPDYDFVFSGFKDHSNRDFSLQTSVKWGGLEAKNRCKLAFEKPLPKGSTPNKPIEFEALKKGKQSAAKRYGCMELQGVLFSGSCAESAEVVERIVTPYSMPPITLTGREIYENVLRDSRYDEGVRLAALKLINLIDKGGEEKSTLQEDLRASFEEAGANKLEAEEMTWNVLGLIGTAGPDLTRRMRYMNNSTGEQQKILGLSVIAASMPLLDHRSSRKGHVYSFPKDVKVTCNTGKPYHFWFTAYLARRAAIESGTPEPAAAMAFQAAKAYHLIMRPKTIRMNFDNGRVVLPSDQSLYTSASQIVRADLAYASAGAIYGANMAGDREPDLNIDKTLAILVKDAGEGSMGALGALGEWMGGDLAATYNKWIQKFNANQAFFADREAGFPKKVNKAYLEFEKGKIPVEECPKM